MLPHDAFYQGIQTPHTLVKLELSLLPILVIPILMTHREGARTSPFSYTLPRPSHQKWEGPNTGLVGYQVFRGSLGEASSFPGAVSVASVCPASWGPGLGSLGGGHLKG